MTKNGVHDLEERYEEIKAKMCKFIKLNAISSTQRYTYVSRGAVLPGDAMLISPDTSRLAEQSSTDGLL
jgi:hypothetical protein